MHKSIAIAIDSDTHQSNFSIKKDRGSKKVCIPPSYSPWQKSCFLLSGFKLFLNHSLRELGTVAHSYNPIAALQEAEEGGSLGARSLRPGWAT